MCVCVCVCVCECECVLVHSLDVDFVCLCVLGKGPRVDFHSESKKHIYRLVCACVDEALDSLCWWHLKGLHKYM